MLTCIDRFTRWPEALLLLKRVLLPLSGWIPRFASPRTEDASLSLPCGSNLLDYWVFGGSTPQHTTLCWQMANGMVERLHCQLKAALKT
jgi:hypothetical protein